MNQTNQTMNCAAYQYSLIRNGVVAVALLLSANIANGFTTIAEGHLRGIIATSMEYDTNIFANSMEEEDMIFAVKPGLEFVRDTGIVHVEAFIGAEVGRFVDFDSQDFEDFKSSFAVSFPHRANYPAFAEMRAGFNQSSEANVVTGTRTEIDELFIDGHFRYTMNHRYGFPLRPSFSSNNYREDIYADVEQYAAVIGLLYVYSPKLEYSLNFRVRANDVEQTTGIDTSSVDHALYIEAVGELMPKLEGSLALGAQGRIYDEDALDDTWTPYIAIGLSWDSGPRTEVVLSGTHDLSYSALNQSSESTAFLMEFRYNYNERIEASVGCYIEYSDYEGGNLERNDDAYGLIGGLDYNFAEAVTLSFDLNYESRDSSLPTVDYERFRANLSAEIVF